MAMPVETGERERWYPPKPSTGETYSITIPILPGGLIVGRTVFDEAHRMTEFCLVAQVLHDGAWWEVVRVDTCHGEVHAHYMYRTRVEEEPETILPIYNQNDVDRGYQRAEKMLITCWEDNVRRWRDGR